MLPFFKPHNEKVVMWVVLVIVPLLSATALGCSSEPVVVEKVVEREVIREVVVTATAVSSTKTPGPAKVATEVAQPAPSPTPVQPTVTPERVIEDYFVIIEGEEIEYWADFPSKNIFIAKTGGLNARIINPDRFLDHLLKEGVITPEQKETHSRGGWIKVAFDDLSVAVYKLLQSIGYHGLKKEFDLGEPELNKLLYHFDESLLESSAVAESTPALKRVGEDYYVILEPRPEGWGLIEYDADFPSKNMYFAGKGGVYSDFSNSDLFLTHLVKEGSITSEQKHAFSRGLKIKTGLDAISIAVYNLLHAKGYIGMKEDFDLVEEEFDLLLYYFDESLLDASKNRSDFSSSFDAASVLARFSTTDPEQGEQRADAAGELIAQHQSGNADRARVLDLLHTIVPELSISERRQAADKLAEISEDNQWGENETAKGVFYLASLITGDEPNPEERIEAAHEMVALYEAGDLDAETTVGLMDTIAPSLSINERRQAAAALSKLSSVDDWDHADRMAAASEVFRLVTGVPLDAESRMSAAVDLTGVGIKIFDTDDAFDDRDIDRATEIIKQSLTGELTTEGLQNILGSGD